MRAFQSVPRSATASNVSPHHKGDNRATVHFNGVLFVSIAKLDGKAAKRLPLPDNKLSAVLALISQRFDNEAHIILRVPV